MDWLRGAGSVAAGSLFGFTNLPFPQVPHGLWAASVPGLILFAWQRPNLILTIGQVGGHMSRYLIHYLRIATQYTRTHPRGALGIAGGAIVGGVMAGASVKIVVHLRETGNAVATVANATRQTMATARGRPTALCPHLANAWSASPTNTPLYRPIAWRFRIALPCAAAA